MKKYLLIFLLILCGCSRAPIEKFVDAKVLSAQNNILAVKFKVGDQTFFEDLELSQSLASYYKNEKIIPLKITVIEHCVGDCHKVEIRLSGYFIKKSIISLEVYEEIRKATVGLQEEYTELRDGELDEGRGFSY